MAGNDFIDDHEKAFPKIILEKKGHVPVQGRRFESEQPQPVEQ
jgi:hypothetical protein